MSCAVLTYATMSKDPALVTLDKLPGVERAVSEDDLRDLIRDNLEPDLDVWREHQLGAGDFMALLRQIDQQWPDYRRNFVALVAIRNNSVSWWAYPGARSWCSSRVQRTKEELERHIRSHGLQFPDTVFVMNGYDKPLCPAGMCAAPVFSFGKCWDPAPGDAGCYPDAAKGSPAASSVQELQTNTTMAGVAAGSAAMSTASKRKRHSPYDDLLLPVLNHPFDQLVSYPWALKTNKAFMRAGLYAAMAANCSRVQLVRLAAKPSARQWLDVGIYKNRHWRVKLSTVSPIPMEYHARYRFVINTDGQAASWRLAKLLAMNSAILKWKSSSIEYYYRSLKPGLHYLDINASSLVPVIEHLQAPSQLHGLEAMASRAQVFAYRYLSQLSRTAYARAALAQYSLLYKPGDLRGLLDLVPPGQALSIPGLLRAWAAAGRA